jgi:hypothetical protein
MNLEFIFLFEENANIGSFSLRVYLGERHDQQIHHRVDQRSRVQCRVRKLQRHESNATNKWNTKYVLERQFDIFDSWRTQNCIADSSCREILLEPKNELVANDLARGHGANFKSKCRTRKPPRETANQHL